MKKQIFSVILVAVLAAGVFAADIPGDFRALAESMIEGDDKIISLYPVSDLAVELFRELQKIDSKFISVMHMVGPSARPISSDVIMAKTFVTRAELAAAVEAYIYGEAFSILANQDLVSQLMVEIKHSVVFAQVLRNSREVLRLQYNTRRPDSTTNFYVVLFVAVPKQEIKNLVDEKAAKYVAFENNGKENNEVERGIDQQQTKLVKKTADTPRRTSSELVNEVSEADLDQNADLIRKVSAIIDADKRIQQYRLLNWKLLGDFEN